MMFVDDNTPAQPPSGNQLQKPWSLPELVFACALESKRQAEMMDALDNLVGCALGARGPVIDTKMLQQLDLWRQESHGLSRLLQLSASMANDRHPVCDADVKACFSLETQRARISYSRDFRF